MNEKSLFKREDILRKLNSHNPGDVVTIKSFHQNGENSPKKKVFFEVNGKNLVILGTSRRNPKQFHIDLGETYIDRGGVINYRDISSAFPTELKINYDEKIEALKKAGFIN